MLHVKVLHHPRQGDYNPLSQLPRAHPPCNAELVMGHMPRRACHRSSSRLLAISHSSITAKFINSFIHSFSHSFIHSSAASFSISLLNAYDQTDLRDMIGSNWWNRAWFHWLLSRLCISASLFVLKGLCFSIAAGIIYWYIIGVLY
jgi:hypothetical protein